MFEIIKDFAGLYAIGYLLKALTLGSEFSFYNFLQYKGVYIQWYFKRNVDEEFKMYLQMTEVNEKVKRY